MNPCSNTRARPGINSGNTQELTPTHTHTSSSSLPTLLPAPTYSFWGQLGALCQGTLFPIPRGGHCPPASFNFSSSCTGVCLSGCRSLGPSAQEPELRAEPGVAEPALWGALHLQNFNKGKPWAPGSGRPSPAPWPGAPHPCRARRYLGRRVMSEAGCRKAKEEDPVL